MPHEQLTPTSLPTFSNPESSAPSVEAPLPPHIDGYRINGLLGSGGMGTVWQATQISTKRTVALKVIQARFTASERGHQRFIREVELAARLEHPHIARVYDSGICRNHTYYAMEWIQGVPLDQYARSQSLGLHSSVALMGSICEAVQYAHQHGVIHRDLKPSNILISADGQAHVLDFGLAKDLLNEPGDQTVSIEGDLIGTPAYMSPEQAAGQHQDIDSRCDVYALGVILYLLLTGQHPTPADGSLLYLLEAIRQVEPRRPSLINPRIPSDLEAVVLKALAKQVDERYQSVAELKHDLDCWLQGLPITLRSANTWYLLRKIAARHRLTTTVMALLTVIVLSFSFTYAFLYHQLRLAHYQLETKQQLLDDQVQKYQSLGRHVLLTDYFLPAWWECDIAQARDLTRYFEAGTRESQATRFLLATLASGTQTDLSDPTITHPNSGFWSFIQAERLLKESKQADAQAAYQKCLALSSQQPEDQWLVEKAQSRLFELEVHP